MDLVEETMVKTDLFASQPSFAGLVVLAESLNPIPFRTRPLNFPAPMVLSLKTWKSRSLPGLQRTVFPSTRSHVTKTGCRQRQPVFLCLPSAVLTCETCD